MSIPKMLSNMRELDSAGFYDNVEYLGDIRSDAALLDTVLAHGVYAFDGGAEAPDDRNGTYKWSLRVYPSEDGTIVRQEVERLVVEETRIVYFRGYTTDTGWTAFAVDSGSAGGGATEILTAVYSVSSTAPENVNLIWIDSANGNLLKVYDSATSAWIPISAAYA